MNLFPSLFHRSGGLVYHWRALLNLKQRWKLHREHTRAFIEEWNPQGEELHLIGPSGGYSLPKEWLRKFKSITAYEPDWIARRIFELRNGIKPKWVIQPFDFKSLKNGDLTFPKKSVILFCNLLGQLHFDEQEGLEAQAELLKLAGDHEFASYHDIVSGDHFRFEWASPMDGETPIRVKYEIEALDPYFSPDEGLTELNLHVHPAAYLFQDAEPFRYQYWEWQITPTQTQVIEGVYRA